MRTKSKYAGLKWLVQAQPPGQAFFETVAAFNGDRVAIDYAKECLARALLIWSAPNTGEMQPFGWRYRVLEHRNNEPKCIYRSDAVATV